MEIKDEASQCLQCRHFIEPMHGVLGPRGGRCQLAETQKEPLGHLLQGLMFIAARHQECPGFEPYPDCPDSYRSEDLGATLVGLAKWSNRSLRKSRRLTPLSGGVSVVATH